MWTLQILLVLFTVILVYQVRSEDLVKNKAPSSQLFTPFNTTVWVNCSTPDPEDTTYESRLQKIRIENGPSWSAAELLVDDWENTTAYCLYEEEVTISTVMAFALPSNVTIDMRTEMQEGKEYTITCAVYEVAPLEYLTIYITRGGDVISNKSYEGPHVKDRQTVSHLYTFIASRSDNLMTFSCEAVLQLGSERHPVKSSEITVQTYALPEAPVISVQEWIENGTTFTVECLVSNGFPPQDVRLDISIEDAPLDVIPVVTDNGTVKGTVHPNASYSLLGLKTIRCESSLFNLSNETMVNVTIYEIPTVSFSLSGNVVDLGENVTATCHITNKHPQPYGLIITVDGEEERMGMSSILTHTFTAGRRTPSLNFTCTAYIIGNPSISRSSMQTLEVHYPPELNESLCPSTFSLVEGITRFMCHGDGNPEPAVECGADGRYIKNTDIVTRDMSGIYTCQATNKRGHVMKKVHVTVQYPPEFNESFCPSILPLVEGQKFSCPADGNPMPTVECGADGRYKKNRDIVTRDMSGIYTCQATNQRGNVSKEISVTVQYPPEFNESSCPSTLHLVEGQKFSCPADGNPKPIVVCGANGRYIKNTDKVTRDMSGNYTCQATNQRGNVSKEISVTVQYKPMTPILTLSTNATITIGDPLTITCKSYGLPDPKYSWQIPNNAEVTYSANKSSVIISTAAQTHSGSYTCVAKNKHGESSTKREVTVVSVRSEDLVKNKAPSSQLFVPFGETVWVNCSTPYPEHTSHESRLQKIDIENGPNWSAVELLVDDWENSTLYCMNGEVEIMTTVMAYALPSNVTIDMPTMLEEEKEYAITCTVYDVAPLEYLTIYITRGDVISNKSYEGPHVKDRQTVSHIYTFNASRSDNLMNFSCEAVLQLGSERHTVKSMEITVQTYALPEAPVISVQEWIENGTTFTVECLVSNGFPPQDVRLDISIEDEPLDVIPVVTDKGTVKGTVHPNASYSLLGFITILCESSLYTLSYETMKNVTIYEIPTVSFSLSGNVVDLGENVTATCHITNKHPQPYGLIITVDGEEERKERTSILTHTFTAGRRTPSLNFTCTAYIIVNPSISRSSMQTLEVHYPPEFIESLCPPTLSLVEGITGFMCHGDGNPEPAVECGADGRYIKNTDTVTRDMSGIYTCQATNKRGHVMKKVHVTVQYPPEFNESFCPSILPLVEGQKFSCPADGNPKPTVECGANGRYIKDTDIVTRDMSGIYTCQATNQRGNVIKLVSVIVQYKPMTPILTLSTNATITIGDPLTITCKSYGLPDPTYSWQIPDNAEVTYSANKSSVIISTAAQTHSGSYTCVATNQHGGPHTTREVTVVSGINIGLIVVIVTCVALMVVTIVTFCCISRRKRQTGSYDVIKLNQIQNPQNSDSTSESLINNTISV